MLSYVTNYCRKHFCFGFWCHPVQLKFTDNQFLAARREKFLQIVVTSRYFSYFKEVYGASRFCWCAVTKKCGPLWRIAKISMRHFRKRCAMAHMAHARIIPVWSSCFCGMHIKCAFGRTLLICVASECKLYRNVDRIDLFLSSSPYNFLSKVFWPEKVAVRQ